MALQRGVFVVVETGAAQGLVVDVETERFDEMKFGAGVGAKADHVARVGRNFGLVENDGKHLSDFQKRRKRVGQLRKLG